MYASKEEIEQSIEKANEYISMPMKYILKDTGIKDILRLTIETFDHWFKLDDEKKIDKFQEYFVTIISAALSAEDIEEGSQKRRGMPCAYLVYGISRVINSFPYHYLRMLENIVNLVDNDTGKIEMMKQLVKQVSNSHLGQAIEMHWQQFSIVPSEEEYYQMIYLKSSYLFTMTYNFLKIMTRSTLDMDRLCYLVTIYFRIRDDYVNLKWNTVAKSKGTIGDDIKEEKFSFPIIHAIQNSEEGSTIMTILKQKTSSEDLKKMVIEMLEKAGSFKYTLDVLNRLKMELLKESQKFGDNPIFKKFVVSLLIEGELTA